MFPDMKVKNYDYVDSIRLSSPTCEQLGIPHDNQRFTVAPVRNTSLQIDGIQYETITKNKPDPFSPYSMIPLPSPFGSVFDSSCIRRRNERERDRVRCVNDGYLKLKEHLPLENKDKRISKVETLRGAIEYIKHLQNILDNAISENVDQTRHSNTSNRTEIDKHGTAKPDLVHDTGRPIECNFSPTGNAENVCPVPGGTRFQEVKTGVPGSSARLKSLRSSVAMRPN